MARMDSASLQSLYAQENNAPMPSALLDELEQVRTNGYAQDMDDVVLGVSALAVSINTYRGPYALMLLVPTARMRGQQMHFRQALFGLRDVIEPMLNQP